MVGMLVMLQIGFLAAGCRKLLGWLMRGHSGTWQSIAWSCGVRVMYGVCRNLRCKVMKATVRREVLLNKVPVGVITDKTRSDRHQGNAAGLKREKATMGAIVKMGRVLNSGRG